MLHKIQINFVQKLDTFRNVRNSTILFKTQWIRQVLEYVLNSGWDIKYKGKDWRITLLINVYNMFYIQATILASQLSLSTPRFSNAVASKKCFRRHTFAYVIFTIVFTIFMSFKTDQFQANSCTVGSTLPYYSMILVQLYVISNEYMMWEYCRYSDKSKWRSEKQALRS